VCGGWASARWAKRARIVAETTTPAAASRCRTGVATVVIRGKPWGGSWL